MLESLEKLREYAPKNVPGVRSEILTIADAIQAEVDERYMELPLDADGVPICVGDTLVNECKDASEYRKHVIVTAVSEHHIHYQFTPYEGDGHHRTGFLTRWHHVKPDPLKELLDDVSKGIICYPRERVTGYLEDNHSLGEAVMLDVRDRLRELLGGDAE